MAIVIRIKNMRNIAMTMVMYTVPVHWEGVLKIGAKDYQHLAHNCCCKSRCILLWKM